MTRGWCQPYDPTLVVAVTEDGRHRRSELADLHAPGVGERRFVGSNTYTPRLDALQANAHYSVAISRLVRLIP